MTNTNPFSSFMGLFKSPLNSDTDNQYVTRADLNKYQNSLPAIQGNATPFISTPVMGLNPTQFINPRYTQAPSVDNSLAPLQALQNYRQTGLLPQQSNSFTNWQQPATPMQQAPTIAASSAPSGGK